MEEYSTNAPKEVALCCIICRRRMKLKGQTPWETVTVSFFEFFVTYGNGPKGYSACDLCRRKGRNDSARILWDLVETLADKLEKEREKNGGNGGKKNG